MATLTSPDDRIKVATALVALGCAIMISIILVMTVRFVLLSPSRDVPEPAVADHAAGVLSQVRR